MIEKLFPTRQSLPATRSLWSAKTPERKAMSYNIWPKGREKLAYPDKPDADGDVPCTASSPDSRFVCTRKNHKDDLHVCRDLFVSRKYLLGRVELAAVWMKADRLGCDPTYYDRDDEELTEAEANEREKSVAEAKVVLEIDPDAEIVEGSTVTFKSGISSNTALARANFPDSDKKYGEIDGITFKVVHFKNDGVDIVLEHEGKLIISPHSAFRASAFVVVKTIKKENTMALSGKSKNGAEEIVYGEAVTFSVDGGNPIVITNEQEAIEWIQRRAEEREKEIQLIENIEGSYPSDGMLSLARVLRKNYGFTRFDSPNPFGKPVVFTIPTDAHGGMADCPWGKFAVPGISGFMQTAVNMDKTGQPIFQIVAKVKNKDKDKVKDLAYLVREDLKKNSIYRGKAIKVEFPDFSETPFDPTVHLPTFMDVSKADHRKLIYSKEITKKIQNSIFTPIQYTERTRREYGSLKRGALLAGPPGTGKTMAANATAKMCEDHGWTFIYLSNTGDLKQSLGFAKMYQPAVIFAEDLDSIICNNEQDEDRDQGSHDILNTLDGVDTKNSDIMVIFTTNYPDKISNVMLRPGRLDAVINILPPDSEAAVKLVRLYGGSAVPANEDLTLVGKNLDGMIPAVICEVVKRAKLAAIPRLGDKDPMVLTSQDLLDASDSMKEHLAMLNRPRKMEHSEIVKAGIAIADRLHAGLRFVGNAPETKRLADNALLPEKNAQA
jgi:ATP-dependent 26S proteasome regulatory subunit